MVVDAAPAAAPSRSRFAALAVGVGILASRLIGLVRTGVIAAYFGTSVYADVLAVGLKIPNLLQNLLGEGTLSASFIPVYAEQVAKGRGKDAGRTAGTVLWLVFLVALLLVVAGVLLAPWIVGVIAPSYEGHKRDMAVTAVRLLFPMTGFQVLAAWALGVLNTHRRFLASYLAPVVWSLAIIGGILVGAEAFGWEDQTLLYAAAVSAVAGGALQFVVQLPLVRRVEPALSIGSLRSDEVRQVVRTAGPAIVGRGVVQLSSFLDTALATLLAVGAVAAMGYAQVIYLLPVSLFGMSIAAAELPELARDRDAAEGAVQARTVGALNRVAFFAIPSAVALLLVGDVVVGLLRRGAFGADQVQLVHYTLAAYVIGVPATTSSRVVSSAFFALRDTVTPARVAAVRVVISTAVSIGMMAQFEPIPFLGLSGGAFTHLRAGALTLGPVGLALGAGVAAWVEWGLLSRVLARRVGGLAGRHGALVRIWAAALPAGACAFAVRTLLGDAPSAVLAAAVFGVFGIVYLGLAALFGIGEVRALWTRVRRGR